MNPELAADHARFLAGYAKQYHAGAFATPTRKDIESGVAETREYRQGAERVVIAHKLLTRPSSRRDFSGARIELPAGARIVTDLARSPGATVPELDEYDVVAAYVEDATVTAAMRAQRRTRIATQITAAGEIIALWGREGGGRALDPLESITVSRLRVSLSPDLAAAATAEARAVSTWHDDYPFYSDGSWGAVSVRGFDRDPQWGVKPSEMGKRWNAEHPGALARVCDWTDLAPRVPAVVEATKLLTHGAPLERVRLLRMAAKRPQSHLGRHTDITDRFAGIRPGLIARLHVPLITHPDVKMSVWSLDGERRDLHLEPHSVWYLDARKPHSVTNASPVDRIHLVIDLQVTPELRSRIAAGDTW